MQIVSISGLDGSGKSTQIKLLQEHLEAQGKKVFYFHAVQFSTPQALKAFFKKSKAKTASDDAVATGEKPGVTKASCLGIFLRKVALAIDIVRFKMLKKKLTDQNVDFLLTDRFFYDTIVNIAFLERKNSPCKLEKIIPRADTAFYLKMEPETIMMRDRAPEQGLAYLEAKKELFDAFAPGWHLQTINGNASPQEISSNIKKQIEKI